MTSFTLSLRHLRSLRSLCPGVFALALAAIALCPEAQAKGMQRTCPVNQGATAPPGVLRPVAVGIRPAGIGEAAGRSTLAGEPGAVKNIPEMSRKLIVIGFMGGRVRADNLVHREALVARDLQERYPGAVQAAVFANRDGHLALETVLRLLDESKDGCLSAAEKKAARIVIYGHSWGASETVTLARRLNQLGIPVLMTIQVDSVQKPNQNDGRIPPNVREAVNFYQSDGLLRGRSGIAAADPARTKILGNFELSYRGNPVSCAGYPWYARAFMRPHIEIENDPAVWSRIEALIRSKLTAT